MGSLWCPSVLQPRPTPPSCALPAALTSHWCPRAELHCPPGAPATSTPTPTQPQTPTGETGKRRHVTEVGGVTGPGRRRQLPREDGGSASSAGTPSAERSTTRGPGRSRPRGKPGSCGSGQAPQGREAPQDGHTTQPHTQSRGQERDPARAAVRPRPRGTRCDVPRRARFTPQAADRRGQRRQGALARGAAATGSPVSKSQISAPAEGPARRAQVRLPDARYGGLRHAGIIKILPALRD